MIESQKEKRMINLHNTIKREFTNFLQSTESEGKKKYIELIERMLNNSEHLLTVCLLEFHHFNPEICEVITNSYYRFEPVLNEAFTDFMHEYEKNH